MTYTTILSDVDNILQPFSDITNSIKSCVGNWDGFSFFLFKFGYIPHRYWLPPLPNFNPKNKELETKFIYFFTFWIFILFIWISFLGLQSNWIYFCGYLNLKSKRYIKILLYCMKLENRKGEDTEKTNDSSKVKVLIIKIIVRTIIRYTRSHSLLS